MATVIPLREPQSRDTKLNVLGDPIDVCSCDPMTGWFRDGTCSTDDNDQGHHVVCCVMSADFLNFSKSRGNDLSTPHPEFGFPGLQPGDHWCLCAMRWLEAFESGMAPQVVLEATHHSALSVVSLDILKSHALQ